MRQKQTVMIKMLRSVYYYAPGFGGKRERWVSLKKGLECPAEAGESGAVRVPIGGGAFLRLSSGMFCVVRAPEWLRRIYAPDELSRELAEVAWFAESRGYGGMAATVGRVQSALIELQGYRATGLSPEQIDDWARKICDIRTRLGYATMDECWEKLCGGNAGKDG